MSDNDKFYKTLMALGLKDYKEGKMIMTLKDAIINYEVFNITTQVKNGELIFGSDEE